MYGVIWSSPDLQCRSVNNSNSSAKYNSKMCKQQFASPFVRSFAQFQCASVCVYAFLFESELAFNFHCSSFGLCVCLCTYDQIDRQKVLKKVNDFCVVSLYLHTSPSLARALLCSNSLACVCCTCAFAYTMFLFHHFMGSRNCLLDYICSSNWYIVTHDSFFSLIPVSSHFTFLFSLCVCVLQ